jgi:hypothetical protein
MLQEASPYRTGQLHDSIQALQLDENTWEITIGNDGTAKHETPSNVYASITNFNRTLGKNGKPNKHYHWVNDTIKKWAEENMLQFQLEGDEDE